MSLNTVIKTVQYGWWMYNWIYKPLFASPIQIVLWPRKSETRIRDEVEHQIQMLKFDLLHANESYFDAPPKKGKKKARRKRRHSI